MKEIYGKRVGEDNYEYGLRLIKYKVENKPDDLDWQDIVELVGLDMHRDTLRKSVQPEYGGYKVYNYMLDKLEKNITNDDIIDKLKKEKQEIYKEKTKLSDERRELRKMLRDVARQDTLKETAIECAKIISKEKPLELRKEFNGIDSKKIGVLLLSDFHVGEEVNNYFNTYNKDIFIRRMQKLTSKVIEYGKLHNIDGVKILNLQDLLSGNIHVTTRIQNEIDIIEQIKFVSETLANMFYKISKEFNFVESYHVTDNHSRTNKNKKEHIEAENFGKIIPWFLNERLRDVKNFKIVENDIEDSIGIVDILGRQSFFVHGHLDNVKSMANKLPIMCGIIPEAIFSAHIHRNYEDDVNGIDIIVNPSGIGANNYSVNKRLTSKAGQKFIIYDEIERRECTYIIHFSQNK